MNVIKDLHNIFNCFTYDLQATEIDKVAQQQIKQAVHQPCTLQCTKESVKYLFDKLVNNNFQIKSNTYSSKDCSHHTTTMELLKVHIEFLKYSVNQFDWTVSSFGNQEGESLLSKPKQEGVKYACNQCDF